MTISCFPTTSSNWWQRSNKSGKEWGYSRPLWVARDGLILPSAVDLTQPDQLSHFLNKRNTIPSSCVFHRRDAFERAGYWPEDIPTSADWHCWRRIVTTSASGRAAYCATPTVLHFQASWRDKPTRTERQLREIAESGSWWPDACRIPIDAGTPEQAAAFAAMASDPFAWSDRMRRGVTEICDRLAWAWVLPGIQTWPNQTSSEPPSPPPPPPPPAVPPGPEPAPKEKRTAQRRSPE